MRPETNAERLSRYLRQHMITVNWCVALRGSQGRIVTTDDGPARVDLVAYEGVRFAHLGADGEARDFLTVGHEQAAGWILPRQIRTEPMPGETAPKVAPGVDTRRWWERRCR